MKESINKIFKLIHFVKIVDKDKLALVVSEYVNTNALSLNFSLFIDEDYDNLFNIFDKEKKEMIASSLAHHMSGNIDDFYSLNKLKNMLQNIQFNRTLSQYDLFLETIDLKKERCMYLVISLIDKLVFIGSPAVRELEGYEFIDIFEFILTTSDFAKAHSGLLNIIRYAMTRMIFQHEQMEILRVDETAIKRMDSLLLETSRTKEAFLSNVNSFPITYFLQEMIQQSGDMSRYQLAYRSVINVCGIVMDEDVSGSIIFFDKEVQKYYIEMNDKLSDYAYSN